MTLELRYLLFTAILTGCLWIPVVIGYVSTRGFPQRSEYKAPPPTSSLPDWVQRANRAHLNAVETFAPFAAVVLIARAAGVSTSITAASAAIFFGARIVHAVLHISGFQFFKARTVVFCVGWAAFMAFAVELVRST